MAHPGDHPGHLRISPAKRGRRSAVPRIRYSRSIRGGVRQRPGSPGGKRSGGSHRARRRVHADALVITPSHNPPEDGGFKYNPPHGGPADSKTTGFIQCRANEILKCELAGVRRVPFARARKSPTTKEHDFIAQYTGGLREVIDMDAIRGVNFGVDPLG